MGSTTLQLREATALGSVLTEDAPSQGRFKIRIIKAGWGSSGYYPAAVLRNDGPKVFSAGTQMFMDHPTFTEDWERPERTVRDLVGVLASDPVWNEEAGALDGEMLAFSNAAPLINELAPHIGLSIRAKATAEWGEQDGQFGNIITGLIEGVSVDVVTRAGAGGAILGVLESAGAKYKTLFGPLIEAGSAHNKEEAVADTTLSAEQATALTTAMTALTEALNREATDRRTREEAARAAQEAAAQPDPVAIATALAASGLPKVMFPDVQAAITAGTAVEEAITAAKARFDAIVAEARPQTAPAGLLVGAPKPTTESGGALSVGGLTFDLSEARLSRALTGKAS